MSTPEPRPATGPKLDGGAELGESPKSDDEPVSEDPGIAGGAGSAEGLPAAEMADSEPEAGTRATRWNQPWRVAVATSEVIVAALLVFGAWKVWQHGSIVFEFPVPEAPAAVVRRLVGSWIAAAIGTATLAGLLAMDAPRQLTLAVRSGPT